MPNLDRRNNDRGDEDDPFENNRERLRRGPADLFS